MGDNRAVRGNSVLKIGTGPDGGNPGVGAGARREHPPRGRVPPRSVLLPDRSDAMSDNSYRGFTFEAFQPSSSGANKEALRATRGRISLFVEVEGGELPTGWRLRDLLEYEINRLLEPTTLRHVDHLN